RHTRWPRDWSSDVCSSDLLRPGDAHSMLSSQRPFELPDQRRNLVCDMAEFFQVSRAAQVEHWPDVQKPRGSVAVVADLQAERFQIGRASCRERVEITGGGV